MQSLDRTLDSHCGCLCIVSYGDFDSEAPAAHFYTIKAAGTFLKQSSKRDKVLLEANRE